MTSWRIWNNLIKQGRKNIPATCNNWLPLNTSETPHIRGWGQHFHSAMWYSLVCFHVRIFQLLLESNCWFPASCLDSLKCKSDYSLWNAINSSEWRTYSVKCLFHVTSSLNCFPVQNIKLLYWMNKTEIRRQNDDLCCFGTFYLNISILKCLNKQFCCIQKPAIFFIWWL